MEKKSRNIGVKVELPKEKCEDKFCPFHGNLNCRGRLLIGTVVSSKMQKSAVVEWSRKHYLKKYERYEKRKTRIKAHNPLCINAAEGDIVKIIECRPLSKTKNFVIIEKIGSEKGFKEKSEALDESKVKKDLKKDKEEALKNESIKVENN